MAPDPAVRVSIRSERPCRIKSLLSVVYKTRSSPSAALPLPLPLPEPKLVADGALPFSVTGCEEDDDDDAVDHTSTLRRISTLQRSTPSRK